MARTLFRTNFEAPPVRGQLRTTEGLLKPESYASRDGYSAIFLGDDYPVPLPGLGKWKRKVATRLDAPGEYLLPYRHFSVAVVKSWRLPLFSAANIDGKREKKVVSKSLWRRDSRIDAKYQILEECYGNQSDGFFSRGHMTRREDSNWGTQAQAEQADADTFHVTNACPQAQSFNAPVWLKLEDYLLKHARVDNMRISVFSGPVLNNSDITMHGVKIPKQFWKIVAFLHDETGKLVTTAYLASQAKQIDGLRRPAFVFGEFSDWQVSVATISELTGLNFNALKRSDPLRNASTDFALELRSLSSIYLS